MQCGPPANATSAAQSDCGGAAVHYAALTSAVRASRQARSAARWARCALSRISVSGATQPYHCSHWAHSSASIKAVATNARSSMAQPSVDWRTSWAMSVSALTTSSSPCRSIRRASTSSPRRTIHASISCGLMTVSFRDLYWQDGEGRKNLLPGIGGMTKDLVVVGDRREVDQRLEQVQPLRILSRLVDRLHILPGVPEKEDGGIPVPLIAQEIGIAEAGPRGAGSGEKLLLIDVEEVLEALRRQLE